MNPNYGKNTFDFDLGIGTNRSRSLNDHKNKPSPYPSQSGAPSWQPNRPSWVHQPAPSSTPVANRSDLGGPTSMVGDIFGKTWNSVAPANKGPSGVGIRSKDPNLFQDLVSSALGQNKNNSNAPLKSSAPVTAKNSFSMGSMADSLPTTKVGSNNSSNYGYNTSSNNGSNSGGYSMGSNTSSNNGSNLGGYSMGGSGSGGIGGGGIGLGAGSKKDPFGSLFDLGSKPSGGIGVNSGGKASFGEFPNASMSGSSKAYSNNNSMGSNQTQSQNTGSDTFDAFFPAPSVGVKAEPQQSGDQQSYGGDDWGFSSDIGGGDDGGSTTELDGLPPPPAGVSASSAKSKGLDNYKQGQYADAIKWLSWALVLLEKAGDANNTKEVLTCRASCYKEVGEYKKAVADCTTVLGHNGEDVTVLVQRALLYESMEKYKLGAEDLRTVMKLDPANRVARSTIHRLTKMID